MKYFSEDTVFDPRNLDTDHLQSDMDFYHSVHDWYAHAAIMSGDKKSARAALKAYVISQTLKAVLCLCVEGSENQELYEQMLNEICPIHSKTKTTVYEFTAKSDE